MKAEGEAMKGNDFFFDLCVLASLGQVAAVRPLTGGEKEILQKASSPLKSFSPSPSGNPAVDDQDIKNGMVEEEVSDGS